MCGLSGLLFFPRSEEIVGYIRKMNRTLHHRGPDGSGVWLAKEYGLALGHNRLAIIDRSAAGKQPMHSHDGRFVCVFNGEVYNHLALRKELAATHSAPNWHGHSDTETLLACFSAWGIQTTLQRCVGMFAIAVWDTVQQRLYLICDRVGEKPLYFGHIANYFAFASELKAFHNLPGFTSAINRQALGSYMQQGYIQAPYSIYQGISKLLPGHLLTIDLDAPNKLHTECWWSFQETALTALQRPYATNEEALDALRTQLNHSIQLQSLADVPVGAFLSGGLDSTTITGLLQQCSSQPLKTFTVGFQQQAYDEAEHAKTVAHFLGTDHHSLRIEAKDAQELIPQLPQWYDEPFADPSQLPTALISHYARQQVTVALSGDAGDELFGGYDSYLLTPEIWQFMRYLPQGMRNQFAVLLKSLPPYYLDWLANKTGQRSLRSRNLQKLGESLYRADSLENFFYQLAQYWPDPQQLVYGSAALHKKQGWNNSLPPALAMMLHDSLDELPNDILCKVDRAAMGVSLETRIPFLDHRVIEVAWRIPLTMKIQGRQGKWIIRQLLGELLPTSLINRPKQGFNVPLDNWLRNDLRAWAEDLLDEKTIQRQGYLNAALIRKEWQRFLSGKISNPQRLWTVLMFQGWLERWSNSS